MANWEKIRHEYITTNISQRKLAEKYNVRRGTLLGIANRDGWAKDREEYRTKVRTKTEQKSLDSAVDLQTDINTTAMKIRAELMNRIYELLMSMPKVNGTKSYQQKTVSNKKDGTQQLQAVEYNLRDLVGAYRDIQKVIDEKTSIAGTDDDPLMEILKRWDKASGITSQSETT